MALKQVSRSLSDTSKAAEVFQVQMLKRAGTARRVDLVRNLSETMIQLSRRAIARRHPRLSSEEVNLVFVELSYGRDLAERVERYMQGAVRG